MVGKLFKVSGLIGLMLFIDFPDTILDLNSMKYYKIINMDFKELLGLRKLSSNELTISEQPGALESFSFFKNSATLFNIGGTFADLKFSYSNERYSFKLGIIPKATGIFCVNFLWPIQLNDGFDEGLNLKNYIDLGLTIDGRRRVPIHKATYVVINNGETNFDLFEANCRAISLEVPIEGNIYYEQKGTFTFEVVK